MDALHSAWARLKAQPQLLALLWAAHLIVVFAATRPFDAALSASLDHRPAAWALLRGDDGLLGELLSDHPALPAAAASGAQVAMLLWGLASWILAGGILAWFARARGGTLTLVIGSSVAHAVRMLMVGAAGLLLRIVPLLAGGLVLAVLRPMYHDKGWSQLVATGSLLVLVVAVSWAWVSVTIDYARLLVVADAQLNVFRALGRATKLALRARRSTGSVVLFSLVVQGAVTGLQTLLFHRVPVTSSVGFVFLTGLGLVADAVRVTTGAVSLVAAGLIANSMVQVQASTPTAEEALPRTESAPAP
jgi:hypothetical protein